MPELDLETIRHALNVARSKGLAEVEIELEDSGFSARFEAAPKKKQVPAVHAAVASGTTAEPELVAISAPHVGYYVPGEMPLAVGRSVERGEIVASINALGLANDVESPISGEVLEVLVKPEQPVEFGQVLALVKEL